MLPCLAPLAGQGSRQDLPQHGIRCCQGHAAETIPAGPWHRQRTRTETLWTFIKGHPAHCGLGEPRGHCTLGQRLLPADKTPWGKERVPPPLPDQPQPRWHTEPCPGAGTQPTAVMETLLVTQDISSPPPQLDDCRRGCRGQLWHCPCILCMPCLTGVPLQKGRSPPGP